MAIVSCNIRCIQFH